MSDEDATRPLDPAATSSGSGATAAAATATVAVPAGLHGVVSPYDGNQEEWVEYVERLESYFIANDIDDVAKRRAILLNGVGVPMHLPANKDPRTPRCHKILGTP